MNIVSKMMNISFMWKLMFRGTVRVKQNDINHNI